MEEYPAVKSVAACLRELVEKKAAIVERAAVGKSRDDNRGQRIIPDYTLVHKPVEDEAVVRDARMCVCKYLFKLLMLKPRLKISILYATGLPKRLNNELEPSCRGCRVAGTFHNHLSQMVFILD